IHEPREDWRIENAFEQRLNFADISARLISERHEVPFRCGRTLLVIVSPRVQPGHFGRPAPERFVRVQGDDQREQDLSYGLSEGRWGGRGRRWTPDLSDLQVVGDRFGAQPEVDGKGGGVLAPDVLLEAMRGESSGARELRAQWFVDLRSVDRSHE